MTLVGLRIWDSIGCSNYFKFRDKLNGKKFKKVEKIGIYIY